MTTLLLAMPNNIKTLGKLKAVIKNKIWEEARHV